MYDRRQSCEEKRLIMIARIMHKATIVFRLARPALILTVAFCLASASANSQTPAPARPAPSQPPGWQIAAGGLMSFEVASIRPAEPGARFHTNVNLNMEDEPIPLGGRFSATAALGSYIAFAYKFLPTGPLSDAIFAHLPKWATTDLFTIDAKAPVANPSKDQMRLMMQSLLAERFKLAVHFETHNVPVVALVLVEPRKFGPRLRPHSQGPPCDAKIPPVDHNSPKIPDVWTPICGAFQLIDWTNNTVILGSRNTTIEMLMDFLPALVHLDQPVVDQTGLNGKFDLELNFTPPWRTPKEPSTDAQLDLTGPTFEDALKDQLGLRLKSTRAPVQTLVIDHVEQPSPN
jgi:bla regulator protein BlaR1